MSASHPPRLPVLLLTVDFVLHGCDSLKDKRQRLSGMRQRFGKSSALAVCESAFADSLARAQWSFVATSASAVTAEQALADVEDFVTSQVDAEVVAIERFALN